MAQLSACLVCGAELEYFPQERQCACHFCGRSFPSNAACEKGHYVCDECHAAQGLAAIREGCLSSEEKNPLVLARALMNTPFVYMHGPEHHALVGAALLTAYRNCGGDLDWPNALDEMMARGQKVPGGTCGLWGSCGAGISSGMFVSIVTGANPLSTESWGLANEMSARSLGRIAATGGPRCCKRDSFTAILTAMDFAREKLGVVMEGEAPVCDFFPRNAQCLGKRCPYHPRYAGLEE